MDVNGTEAWLIVVSAFGGGLAGAILQPILAFGLDRVGSKDRRRKVIEQHLRRTVTRWLEFTTRAARTAIEIAARRDLNRSVLSDGEIVARLRLNDQPFPTWEAERIRDAEMRQLADQLYDISVKLPMELLDPATSTERLDERAKTIGDLRRRIG